MPVKLVHFLKSRLIFNIFYCFWMLVNKLFVYLTCVCLKSKRFFNMKSSTYYFHMKTKILADFQINWIYGLVYDIVSDCDDIPRPSFIPWKPKGTSCLFSKEFQSKKIEIVKFLYPKKIQLLLTKFLIFSQKQPPDVFYKK